MCGFWVGWSCGGFRNSDQLGDWYHSFTVCYSLIHSTEIYQILPVCRMPCNRHIYSLYRVNKAEMVLSGAAYSPGMNDIWGWIILCGRPSCTSGRVFSSISGLSHQMSVVPTLLWQPKLPSNITQHSWGANSRLDENQWLRGYIVPGRGTADEMGKAGRSLTGRGLGFRSWKKNPWMEHHRVY
jgi:hypothetical protein